MVLLIFTSKIRTLRLTIKIVSLFFVIDFFIKICYNIYTIKVKEVIVMALFGKRKTYIVIWSTDEEFSTHITYYKAKNAADAWNQHCHTHPYLSLNLIEVRAIND